MIAENLQQVVAGASGAPAAAILQGSYMAGLALSHSRLGLVHGLAHPLGYRFKAAHGLVCGVCLPDVIAFNRDAAFDKYDYLSEALGEDVCDFTVRMLNELKVVSPFRGKPLGDVEGVIQETLASGSTKANPRKVNAEDVAAILTRLFS